MSSCNCVIAGPDILGSMLGRQQSNPDFTLLEDPLIVFYHLFILRHRLSRGQQWLKQELEEWKVKTNTGVTGDLKNEDELKKEDNLKNEDNLKIEDDLKNGDNLKNEDDLKN